MAKVKRINVRTIPEGGDRITVQIEENGEALAHAIFDPPDLEQFIANLASERAKLTDQVPNALDPGTRLKALVDPRWEIRTEEKHKVKVLSLSHPGLGWLSFAIPFHEAAAMAKFLAHPALSTYE